MFLSNIAVRRFIGVIMGVLIAVTMGVVALINLPMDLYPEMNLPMALVITGYEGAGPQEVENMVTRPIEEALSAISDLQELSSYSSAGSSMVMAGFNWGKNMDYVSVEIREKLDLIRDLLPDGASEPIILLLDPSMLPIMQIGLKSTAPVEELTSLAEDTIKNRLERIEGIAMAEISGGAYPRVLIEIDPGRLAAYGVTLDSIRQWLLLENMNYMGGELTEGERVYLVRTLGQLESVEQLSQIVVGYNQAGPVTLGEVAVVREMLFSESMINRLDGEKNVMLSLLKRSDANTVNACRDVYHELNRLKEELPGEFDFSVAVDQSSFIHLAIGNLAESALIGGALAAIVIFLFLRNVSATLAIGCAIPVSLLTTFALIYYQGFTLNILTLGGLALGVGMMVDNSIVVLENIHRLRDAGVTDPAESARRGAGQVFAPIVASTLTTIVVFVPVAYVEGMTKIILKPLAYTISFSLLVSLVVSMTLIPALEARFPSRSIGGYKPLEAVQRGLTRLNAFYRRWLAKAIRHPYRLMGGVLLLLLLSGLLFTRIGGEFMPEMDSSRIRISLNMPVGTPLEETDRVARQAEDVCRAVPEVEHIFTSVGSGGSLSLQDGGEESATIYLLLQSKEERKRDSRVIAGEIREKLSHLPGAEVTVAVEDMIAGTSALSGGGVELSIKGNELDILEQLSAEVVRRIEPLAGISEIQTSFDEGRPELQIRLDREKAAALGITTYQVAGLVETALQGKMITRLRQHGEEIDVYLQGEERLQLDSQALRQLVLVTARGDRVPLEQVAELTYSQGPISITRQGQARSVTVSGGLAAGYNLRGVSREVERALEGLEVPPGYSVEFAGSVLDMTETFADLGVALLFAVALVYMVMAAQFESLLYPLVIMFTLPQAFTGVVLALVISGYTLSMISLIGIILLVGIAVNNGIILVDYINNLRREEGYGCEEAILTAGAMRLRPILMTTGTTVIAMLPMALGTGDGAEIQAPLAAVILGGLTFSTLLTLFLVPAAYKVMDELGRRLMSWGREISFLRRIARRRARKEN